MTFSEIRTSIAPYRNVIRFVLVLLCANFFWKLTITGDEEGGPVSWLGLDVTPPFDWMAHHITVLTASIIGLFKEIAMDGDYTVRYTNGNYVTIIWACTAIKQIFIFTCIMLLSRGRHIRKLWFIPLGAVALYAFNLFRIVFITFTMENHPEWFTFLHEYLFKYLFYGFVFLLWLWWTEKIGKQQA